MRAWLLLQLASAEVLCWRDSVPQRIRSAWSEARCLLQRNAEVPQCGWRVASRSPAQWQVAATLEHKDGICDLTWAPSGRLTAATADGTVSLWEAAEESNFSLLENHPSPSWTLRALLGATSHAPVRDIVWSPDGELLLAASVSGSRVWRLAGNASRIHVEAADNQNETVETESQTESLDVPNSTNETWRPRRLEPPPVQGLLLEPWTVHSMLQQPDTALAVEWSSNESALGRVLAGMREFTACSVAEGGFVPCSEYGHERRMGATYLGVKHSAAIWHSSEAMPNRWALEATFEGTSHLVVSARWSPDGKRVLTGGSDGFVRVWELQDLDFHGSGRKRWNILTERHVHNEAVRAIAWSPDGEEVLTSSQHGANIWRPFNGTWELQGSLTATNGQKLMPNLTNTALHSPENSPRLDTLDPDADMHWIVQRWSPIWVAAWSPDGQRILTGSKDGSARIWLRDPSVMEAWTLEATLHGHRHEVWAVAWSPDGLELVTGDQVGKVRLWRAGDKAAGALMVS